MTGGAPPVRMHIADTVVARLAAWTALGVPGVVALPADIGLAPAATVGWTGGRTPPAGVGAIVADGAAAIELAVVTRLGYRCRDVAQAVQREVAAEVAAYTGLSATVTVTIADILLD